MAILLRSALGEFRTGGLVFSLRDFAVTATIGPAGAAVTPAVYGVLMLTVAAGMATFLSRPVGSPWPPDQLDQA